MFGSVELIKEKRESIFFFCTYAVMFMSFAYFWPYISAHFANMGIDSGRIGILISLTSVVTVFILPIWSRISDRTGNRRAVLKIIALGASFSILLFIVSGSFWALFFTFLLFASFYVCLPPLMDAVVITYMAQTDIKFSSVRIGGTIGFGIMILFTGYIYAYSSTLTFIMASIFFLVLFLLVRKIPQVNVDIKEKRKFDFHRLFRNKKIIFILFIAFAVQISQGFFFGFFGVFVQELGYTSREIGMANFISILFEIPVLLIIDRVLRRFSVITVTIFCGFLVALRMLLLFTATDIGIVYLSMLGNGISFICMYYSCATFINKEMDSDLKSTGQSMLAFFQAGLGNITGNTLGGFISQHVGTRFAFLFFGMGLGIVCFVCVVVFSVIRVRKKRAFS